MIDGDTIEWNGDKIRLANIDTPEIFSPECLAEKMLGLVATRRLAELLADESFTVLPSEAVDAYGRMLATIITKEGEDVGQILINEDLAGPWEGHLIDWCSGP